MKKRKDNATETSKCDLVLPDKIRIQLNEILDLLHVVEGNKYVYIFTDKVTRGHSHSARIEFIVDQFGNTSIEIINRDNEEY
jgi:hypothetical protein